MKIQLLLTLELLASQPESVKTIFDAGKIDVIFQGLESEKDDVILTGNNAVVEGSKEDIIAWLKPFDGIAVGNGVPQMESFTIMHINDEL